MRPVEVEQDPSTNVFPLQGTFHIEVPHWMCSLGRNHLHFKMVSGQITDTEITIKSGILDYIEAEDLIMADKGFPRIEARIAENGGNSCYA